MNEMSELERQLYSLRPRRPSARLERRLFGRRPVPADLWAGFRMSWLVPATAALALTCVLFNEHSGLSLSPSAGSGPMVAMILSNQSAAAYLPGGVQAEQNNLPADAFRWANKRAAASGDAPLPHLISSKRP